MSRTKKPPKTPSMKSILDTFCPDVVFGGSPCRCPNPQLSHLALAPVIHDLQLNPEDPYSMGIIAGWALRDILSGTRASTRKVKQQRKTK